MIKRVVMAPGGPEFSRFAYGMWRLLQDDAGYAPDRVLEKIDACLQEGITTIDHADVYGAYTCEAVFGEALKHRPGLRDKLELVSKCGIQAIAPARPDTWFKHYDFSASHIKACVERSLRNLATDRLDLLLLHRPSPFMNADEIADALTALRSAGKVLHFGVSNFTPAQFDLVASRLDFPLVTNQVQLNLLETDGFFDGTIAHAQTHCITPMAWSPTAGGRIFTDTDAQAVRVRVALSEMAEKKGCAAEALAYAWLLAHPSAMQIVLGTNNMKRVKTAVSALDIKLDLQEWFALLAAGRGEDVP